EIARAHRSRMTDILDRRQDQRDQAHDDHDERERARRDCFVRLPEPQRMGVFDELEEREAERDHGDGGAYPRHQGPLEREVGSYQGRALGQWRELLLASLTVTSVLHPNEGASSRRSDLNVVARVAT